MVVGRSFRGLRKYSTYWRGLHSDRAARFRPPAIIPTPLLVIASRLRRSRNHPRHSHTRSRHSREGGNLAAACDAQP